MAASTTPVSDALLVKYLNEAYGKEKQLETALAAQIALAVRPQLKKGLQEHLKVTKAQSRGLAKRMKELGGKASTDPDIPGPDVVAGAAGAAANVANRAIAAAKAPVQALRGTSPADNDLRNVRDCLWNEAEEIAHYIVIEATADALKDSETAKLARTYRKEEEKMQRLLERQVPAIVKEVIKEEVPTSERPTARRASSSRRGSASSRSSSKPAVSRSSSSKPASSRSSSTKSAAKKPASRKPAGRKPAARKTAARKTSASS